jgi:hypothetical protein
MSIDKLSIGANANFHQLAEATNAVDVKALFTWLRKDLDGRKYPVHFREVRQVHGACTWSAIGFSYPRPAGVLPAAGNLETVVGYILLVEYKGHLAVFKSGLDLSPDFKKKYVRRLSHKTVQYAVAAKGSVFEKIRVRNLSPSKSVLRSKTLEAHDIAAVVGAAGNNRYAPQSFALVNGEKRLATTLSTARIGQRLTRRTHLQAIDWAAGIIDQLVAPRAEGAPFLEVFAEPVELAALTATPTAFMVNVPILKDMVFDPEPPEYRLVTKEGEEWTPVDYDDALALTDRLDVALKVVVDEQGWSLDGSAGALKRTATTIALAAHAASDGFYVEPLGATVQNRTPIDLRTFIDREDLFMVLFDEPSLAWVSGALFQDKAFGGSDQVILNYLKDRSVLEKADDEKGAFEDGQTQFAENSVFRILIDDIAKGDTTLVCDDLDDEWADFIGIGTEGSLPLLTFYHAKHGALSLGASPFHVAVSQGIKNLGRLSPPKEALGPKVASWNNTYNNKKKRTDIPRIVRGGDPDAVLMDYEAVRIAPEVVKRVSIVTSSLSKKAVKKALDDIKDGGTPDPHFVQLYWLLSSFFSACAEAGVAGSVICQP